MIGDAQNRIIDNTTCFGGMDTTFPHPTTERNAPMPDVKTIQSRLLSLGYPLPRFGVDGHFGAETERLLELPQEENPVRKATRSKRS